eukprot:gene29856-39617_t
MELLQAAKDGNNTLVQAYLDEGSNVNWCLADGIRPLATAVDHGHLETARLLLDRGASIDAMDKNGLTALHIAIGKGRVDILQLLMEKGANPCKALRIAVSWGNSYEAVKLALDRRAWIETMDRFGRTILMIAIAR